MAQTAATRFCSPGRACARVAQSCVRGAPSLFAGVLLLALLLVCSPSRADPVAGEVDLSTGGGYARLVLKLAEQVETEVTAAGSIIVIRFKRPVDISIDKLPEAAPDYIASVRRDPDGSAIRLSLTRRVTINTMVAGERVFVDFMPESWVGPPPPVPPEVVRELAERARAAERALRLQRATKEAYKRPPVRVRASVQPTFVRFFFELPDGVGISSALNDDKLTLSFNASLTFDLADAKLAAPANVATINQKIGTDSSTVEFALIGDVDVHSFREEKSYSIDIGFQQPERSSGISAALDSARAQSTPASVTPKSETPASVPKPKPSDLPASESGGGTPPGKMGTEPGASPNLPQATEAAPSPPAETGPTAQPEKQPEKEPPAAVVEAAVPPPPIKMQPAAALALPATKPRDSAAKLEALRSSSGFDVTFGFAVPTAAALFRRADTVWLVFDSQQPIDLEPIRSKGLSVIAEVNQLPLETGQAIRIRLIRPQLPSLVSDDQTNWTLTFADSMRTPSQPLATVRNISDPAFANVTVPMSSPGHLHRFVDPDAGDPLIVITAPSPIRGFIRRQDFVEFSLLESIHGIAIRPKSDDVTVELASDKLTLGRPGGLTLSSADVAPDRATAAVRPIFDGVEWRKNQTMNFNARQNALVAAVSAEEPNQRTAARIDLARFYMSRELYAEAKGVLDLVVADAKPGSEDPVALMVHSVASTLMGRPSQALIELASPAIGSNYDSQLWKALAYARDGKWGEAREKFKKVEFAITSLPLELQRILVMEALRASLEVRDYPGATKYSSDLDVIGLSSAMKGEMAVLRGRLAEALGHDGDALREYKAAAASSDQAAAAQANLLGILLRLKRDQISQAELLQELEILAVTWRGDAVEVKASALLARIYSEMGRYGQSLEAARMATRLQPNSEVSRQAQDAAAALFAQLFLSPKGDDLPVVDALGIFYEFRELTPIGRRGDEMIRRLADKLVSVDLLDQASELLQYQVDKRLEGAARAQVAARLAMVYLTSRKPDRAIAALHSTRMMDLAGELRQQRLLLEARAQSDIGRHDLALDIITNVNGREAIRLRSDIQWAARHWREASEQIELYYADRWRDFKPLDPMEKADVIRALVGYALAEDIIGLARFREKYAPLMTGKEDRAAFDTASRPTGATSVEFAEIARMAASVDTLDGFLREMRTRFPDATARAPLPPETPKADQFPTGALPAIIGSKRAGAGSGSQRQTSNGHPTGL
jgi:tetratricopeptide (TPR) repeat protein